MKLLIAVFLSVLALATLATAIEYPEEVVTLTEENFLDAVQKKEFALVEFYAPWCGHCKQMAPEYIKAAKQGVDNVVFTAMDCTAKTSGKVCDKNGIKGFPTIQLWKNGKYYKDFEAERTASGIVKFLKKKTQPAVAIVEASAVDATIAANKESVLILAQNVNDEDLKALTAVADTTDFTFAAVKGAGGDAATYTIYASHLKSSDGSSTFDKSAFDSLKQWVDAKAYPLVGIIDQNTFVRFDESGLPLLFLFTSLEDAGKNVELVEAAAEKFQGKINAGFIDGVAWKEQLTIMGLPEDSSLPVVAMLDVKKQLSYPYLGKDVTADAVTSFVEDFVAGKLTPYLRSEEIPETPLDPVTNVMKLVSKNFDESIKDKNALVMFYAPWCGHCKTLKPIFNAVATHVKDVEGVTVGNVDATLNDVSRVSVQGFPTIFLFKADGTQVEYNGARTGTAFLEFLKGNLGDNIAEAIEKAGTFKEEEAAAVPTAGGDDQEEEEEEGDDDEWMEDDAEAADATKHADL